MITMIILDRACLCLAYLVKVTLAQTGRRKTIALSTYDRY